MDTRFTKPNRKPTFFWQGLLIILPVIALAIMGVVFLRQDKSLVKQQAKENAQRLSDEIARYISSHLERHLLDRDIQSVSVIEKRDLNLNERHSILTEQDSYHIPLQPHRELIEGYLHSKVRPLFRGPIVSSEGDLIDPPLYPAVPNPDTESNQALSPQQRRLWEMVPQTSANLEALLQTLPPEPFVARAKFALAQWRKEKQPVVAERLLREILSSSNAVFTESGLPLPPLAAMELMRLQTAEFLQDSNIVYTNVQTTALLLASNAVRYPSSLSPLLLDEADQGGRALIRGHRRPLPFPENVIAFPHGDPSVMNTSRIQEIERWKSRWQADQLRISFYEDLRAAGLVRPGQWQSPTAFWTTWNGEERLVSATPFDPKGADDGIRGHELLTASESLLEVALLEALDQSKIRLPAYASIGFEVCGKAFPKEAGKPKEFPYRTSGPWLDLGAAGYVDLLSKRTPAPNGVYDFELSEAQMPKITNATEILGQTLETLVIPYGLEPEPYGGHAMEVPGLKVQIRLAQPQELFAIQRKRVLIFGSLIAFAAVVAMVGFLTAHRAFQRQLRLNEMKSNFVSSVSHELRAPIASIRLMAEGLERGKISEPPKQREYFRFIMQECRRLSSLIENVLDFSRIEQGRKQYEMEPTDIATLTSETVKLMEPYADEKQVRLQCAIDPRFAAGGQATMDGRAIQQALINLIDNAIKHSRGGASVKIALVQSGATLSLSVADHGPGIPHDQQEKIFERFYRLGSELRRETQGVGIGLSIVKHIVEAHGGKIIVQSAPGQGSCFTIEIPTENAEARS